MGRGDRVAQSFRAAREGHDWTMRDVETLTGKMGDLAPDLYAKFSRSKLTVLENEGGDFLERTKDFKALRAVVHLMFNTDERFISVVGQAPPYGLTPDADFEAVRKVPLFDERAQVSREDLSTGTNCSGNVAALSPTADYAVAIQDISLYPYLTPGHNVHVALATAANPGDLAVLLRDQSLCVAWCLRDGEYGHNDATFTLTSADQVVGVVVSLRPYLPPSAR